MFLHFGFFKVAHVICAFALYTLYSMLKVHCVTFPHELNNYLSHVICPHTSSKSISQSKKMEICEAVIKGAYASNLLEIVSLPLMAYV